MSDEEGIRCGVCQAPVALRRDGTVGRHGTCEGTGEQPLVTQYGVRWATGKPVFAYRSRREAEQKIDERGFGVLMSHAGIPGRPWHPWAPVDADDPL
ncbi:hypothetical protein AB0A77_37955 [Streptomyces varsoviensis]|uniref:hypothetical protein n=1 Tax=Streptomyces varsoviensis TaxID=67373 RepID=UPI0033F762C7